MTDPTRRLCAVQALPGQLTLDLPGLPLPAELPAPAPRRSRPAGHGEQWMAAGDVMSPVRRLLPTRHTDHGPGVVARVPVAVWDGEDLVGVYAQESTARADAAVLQRDAAPRGGARGERGLPAPAGVHPVPAHPPGGAVDTAGNGPVTGLLPRVARLVLVDAVFLGLGAAHVAWVSRINRGSRIKLLSGHRPPGREGGRARRCRRRGRRGRSAQVPDRQRFLAFGRSHQLSGR